MSIARSDKCMLNAVEYIDPHTKSYCICRNLHGFTDSACWEYYSTWNRLWIISKRMAVEVFNQPVVFSATKAAGGCCKHTWTFQLPTDGDPCSGGWCRIIE